MLKWMKWALCFLASLLLFICNSCIAQGGSGALPLHVQDSSPFPSVEASALSEIRIPLRIPKFLPRTGGTSIFSSVIVANANRYEIVLATILPCTGGANCTYGSVEGGKAPLEPIVGNTIRVPLGHSLYGIFTASECFAFCDEAHIRWKEKGIFYSIGVRAMHEKDLVDMAKSAIEEGRRVR